MTALILVGEVFWLTNASAIGSKFAAANALIGMVALAARTWGLHSKNSVQITPPGP